MSGTLENRVRSLATKTAAALSYPIAGNFSGKLKERIERRFPAFNSATATITSYFTNAAVYGTATGYFFNGQLSSSDVLLSSGLGLVVGALVGIAEMTLRFSVDYSRMYVDDRCAGSIVGEIVSLPVEYLLNRQQKHERQVR